MNDDKAKAIAAALLPCPFCGSPHVEISSGVGEFWGFCRSCRGTSAMTSTLRSATIAWNTRAALSPKPVEVAPEDEALIEGVRAASFRHAQDCPLIPYDHRPEVTGAMESLRRRIAGLRDREESALRTADTNLSRALHAEAALSAMEDDRNVWKASAEKAHAELAARMAAKVPEWKRELVHKTIAKTLRNHRLQHSCVDGDTSEHYPLLDALTPDGETVEVGQQEIELLTDAIYLELLAAAPESPRS